VEKQIPDTLSAGVLALKCREASGKPDITLNHILDLCRGLQILVPDLIRVENKDVVISAPPDKIASAIALQLEKIKTAPAADFAKGL